MILEINAMSPKYLSGRLLFSVINTEKRFIVSNSCPVSLGRGNKEVPWTEWSRVGNQDYTYIVSSERTTGRQRDARDKGRAYVCLGGADGSLVSKGVSGAPAGRDAAVLLWAAGEYGTNRAALCNTCYLFVAAHDDVTLA